MALSAVKTWSASEVLTASDLNAEFANIYNNPLSLVSPLTGNLDFDGNQAISFVVESGTSNPGSELNAGRFFYRSTMKQYVKYDGSNWVGAGPTVHVFTNKSGGSLALNDLVILDSSNASSVTTTSTAAVTDTPFICLETIANDASGLFLQLGYHANVPVTGATSIGDYLTTSTTVKKSVSTSSFGDGVFAQALTSTGAAGNVSAILFGISKVTADLPKGYLDGGAMSNGTDTTNDIDFTACECRDDGDTVNIVAGALTKQLDAEWAVGTGAGGLAAGDDPIGGANNLIAWAISKTDGTASDFFFSTSASPILPTGYTVKRQVGWFRWDGSTIEQFDQIGTGRERHHRYRDPIQDVSDSTITANTAETATLIVPPDNLAKVIIYVTNDTQVASATIFPTNGSDTTSNNDEAAVDGDASGGGYGSGQATVLVDSSSQCKYMADEGAGVTTVKVNTLGFTIYL